MGKSRVLRQANDTHAAAVASRGRGSACHCSVETEFPQQVPTRAAASCGRNTSACAAHRESARSWAAEAHRPRPRTTRHPTPATPIFVRLDSPVSLEDVTRVPARTTSAASPGQRSNRPNSNRLRQTTPKCALNSAASAVVLFIQATDLCSCVTTAK